MILDNKDKKKDIVKIRSYFKLKKRKTKNLLSHAISSSLTLQADKFSVSVQICTKIVKSLKHHKSLTVTLNISRA